MPMPAKNLSRSPRRVELPCSQVLSSAKAVPSAGRGRDGIVSAAQRLRRIRTRDPRRKRTGRLGAGLSRSAARRRAGWRLSEQPHAGVVQEVFPHGDEREFLPLATAGAGGKSGLMPS